jgi:hypothetical protein
VAANEVLSGLRQSSAVVFTVTIGGGGGMSSNVGQLAEESGREQVLGDGPKQSGGRRTDVVGTPAVPKALQQVADDLTSQYAISYTLPDGVKPDRRFSISVDRKGLSLRAPTALSDR